MDEPKFQLVLVKKKRDGSIDLPSVSFETLSKKYPVEFQEFSKLFLRFVSSHSRPRKKRLVSKNQQSLF